MEIRILYVMILIISPVTNKRPTSLSPEEIEEKRKADQLKAELEKELDVPLNKPPRETKEESDFMNKLKASPEVVWSLMKSTYYWTKRHMPTKDDILSIPDKISNLEQYFKKKPIESEGTLLEIKEAYVNVANLLNEKLFEGNTGKKQKRLKKLALATNLLSNKQIMTSEFVPKCRRVAIIMADEYIMPYLEELEDRLEKKEKITSDWSEDPRDYFIRKREEEDKYEAQKEREKAAAAAAAATQSHSSPFSLEHLKNIRSKLKTKKEVKEEKPVEPFSYTQRVLLYRSMNWLGIKSFVNLKCFDKVREKLQEIRRKYGSNLLGMKELYAGREAVFDYAPITFEDLEKSYENDNDRCVQWIDEIGEIYLLNNCQTGEIGEYPYYKKIPFKKMEAFIQCFEPNIFREYFTINRFSARQIVLEREKFEREKIEKKKRDAEARRKRLEEEKKEREKENGEAKPENSDEKNTIQPSNQSEKNSSENSDHWFGWMVDWILNLPQNMINSIKKKDKEKNEKGKEEEKSGKENNLELGNNENTEPET